jgi:hypothetical protein
MSRNNRQVVKPQGNVVYSEVKAATQATTVEDYARELVQAFELEVQRAQERQKGQSLPYADIIEGVDIILSEAGTDKAPTNLLAEKVGKLLAFKYSHMSDAHNTVTARIGSRVVNMEACALKALRLEQLKHMLDTKVKDNLYRRIYGLGYRKEFKRFELVDGQLRRISKPVVKDEEEPTS